MHLTLCAFLTFQENITYLLTAIRASFKKIRAQEEPKCLPPDAFPGLQICQNCFCGRSSAPDPTEGAYSAPPDPIAGLRGPTSKGKEREGREDKGRGGEKMGKLCPLFQIPGSALYSVVESIASTTISSYCCLSVR